MNVKGHRPARAASNTRSAGSPKRFAFLLLPGLLLLTAALGAGRSHADLPGPADDRTEVAGASDHQSGENQFTFAVTADMRAYSGPGAYDTSQYFGGVCEAIAGLGSGAFMVSPGDIDPPAGVMWTITRTLGITYTWYPVAGNHETETAADMDWLRSYDYGPVNPGPSGCVTTTYSFDHQNAHFVMLNEYCDTTGDTVTNGDIPDHLCDWLAADLSATTQEHIFVFGHEPAYPQPDAANGRERHMLDSLNQHASNRDRFWTLLGDEGVAAYICGHTHNYSAVNVDGVWQLDAGHARGIGDTGARSTFILIHVDGPFADFETYRDNYDGGPYDLTHSGTLVPSPIPHLSLHKEAVPFDGLHNNRTLTYTLTISGPGLRAELRDPLATSVQIITDSVTPPAVYSPAVRSVLWESILPTDAVQVIRFRVTPAVSDTALSPPIANTAWLSDETYARLVSSSTIVNGWRFYLPLVTRKYQEPPE